MRLPCLPLIRAAGVGASKQIYESQNEKRSYNGDWSRSTAGKQHTDGEDWRIALPHGVEELMEAGFVFPDLAYCLVVRASSPSFFDF